MQMAFQNYLEILLFDGTYNLLECLFTVFVFIVIGANGETLIIGLGLTRKEDAYHLTQLVKQLIKYNAEPATRVK